MLLNFSCKLQLQSFIVFVCSLRHATFRQIDYRLLSQVHPDTFGGDRTGNREIDWEKEKKKLVGNDKTFAVENFFTIYLKLHPKQRYCLVDMMRKKTERDQQSHTEPPVPPVPPVPLKVSLGHNKFTRITNWTLTNAFKVHGKMFTHIILAKLNS